MPFEYTVSDKDIYGRDVTASEYQGYAVIGFRPPAKGEVCLCLDGTPAVAGHDFENSPRLILRKKEPKYRYVTDGVLRTPEIGEFVPGTDRWIQVTQTPQYYAKQLCFTREEVKE